MRVLFDSRPATANRTGIGRYAQTLSAVACGATFGKHEFHDGRSLLGFASAAEEELALPSVLEREGVEVLHSPLFHVAAVLPAKVVITLHDAIPVTHPELTTDTFKQVWAGAREAATRADAVICPTASARRDVIAGLGVPPEKVFLVPETPHPIFRPEPAEGAAMRRRYKLGDESFVLVLGALEGRKNPTLVLDALRSGMDLPRAVFVGPSGAVDLEREAAQRGVSSRVRHLGVLPDRELVGLLTAASALVFPTLAEGFGLPVVEAFAAETPVVASSVPAVAEVAGDAALLVPPGDPDALVNSLRLLLASPELAEDLTARGKDRLKLYSPGAVRAALVALYDTLDIGGT